MKTRVHIIIKGDVQGVFFRSHIRSWAAMLDVKGWVRNTGMDVEAVFEGEKEAIEEMVHLCRKGPNGAAVDDVDVEEQKFRGEFATFEIR